MRKCLIGKGWLVTILALVLSGCSTTPGVRVVQATPPPPHVLPAIQVVADNENDRWATTHGLASANLGVVNEPGAWTLRATSSLSWEVRRDEDPFCDPWLGRRGYWAWHDPWYRPYAFGNCRFPARERAFEVRTLTWSLEDERGQLRWHASSSQSRPSGPPVEEALRLGQALRTWAQMGP